MSDLVRGGQGRTDADVAASGTLFGVALGLALVLVLLFCVGCSSTAARMINPESEVRRCFSQ